MSLDGSFSSTGAPKAGRVSLFLHDAHPENLYEITGRKVRQLTTSQRSKWKAIFLCA
jgi:hypothetical protein